MDSKRCLLFQGLVTWGKLIDTLLSKLQQLFSHQVPKATLLKHGWKEFLIEYVNLQQ